MLARQGMPGQSGSNPDTMTCRASWANRIGPGELNVSWDPSCVI